MLDFVFTRHGLGDLKTFFGGFGVEERDVFFAAALAFEVDRQAVGARCHQYPENAPAVFGVAHGGGDLREDALIDARIAVQFARAQRGVGLVDQDDYRRERLQQVENLLQVGLGRADPFVAEVFELDHVQPAVFGEAFGQEGLAGPDRAADQYAHRRLFAPALGDHLGDGAQTYLGLSHPAYALKTVSRCDELDQSGAFRFDDLFLLHTHVVQGQPVVRVAGRAE